MKVQHIVVSATLLTLLACLQATAQEKFHLKSDKTGRVYGPFELVNSNKVEIGAYTMTILLPERPASVTPSPQPSPPPGGEGGEKAAPPGQPPAVAGDPEAERAALVAAAPWLMVIDKEQYDQSWDGIADYLKRSVDKDQFLTQLKTVRKIFGRLVARTAKRTQFLQSMPSAPDGSYIVIQYETEFKEKKAAVETVIMVLDRDGKWRVSGYDVR